MITNLGMSIRAPAQDVEKECSGTSQASIYSPLVAAGHVIMAISDG